jgi:hypothetical protein
MRVYKNKIYIFDKGDAVLPFLINKKKHNMLTSNYKSRNKLRFDDNCKYHQTQFIPQNIEKVIGDPRILCRSSWETRFADWCDRNPQVIKWGSECVNISYRDPTSVDLDEAHKYNLDITNPINWKVKNYYPDFYVHMVNGDGTEKKFLIEVKPYAQTQPPKPINENAKLKDVKAFNNAARTFLQNDAKWKAAREWCKMHEIEFVIFTENELERIGLI